MSSPLPEKDPSPQGASLKIDLLESNLNTDANETDVVAASENQIDPTPASDPNIDGGIENKKQEENFEILAADGDLTIRSGKFSFQVLSHIMVLASPYFAELLKMAGVDFNGTITLPQGNTSVITLDHKHPECFRTVLQVLHFKQVAQPQSIAHLANIATVCDDYSFQAVISAQACVWMEHWVVANLGLDALKRLLWVAYVFKLEAHFKKISARMALLMYAVEARHLCLSPMPNKIKDSLIAMRSQTHKMMCEAIENAILEMKSDGNTHVLTEWKTCLGCDVEKPGATKICRLCSSSGFMDKKCDSSLRLLQFINYLQRMDSWPIYRQQSRSCLEVHHLICLNKLPSSGMGPPYVHRCSIALKTHTALVNKLQEIIADVPGIDLTCHLK